MALNPKKILSNLKVELWNLGMLIGAKRGKPLFQKIDLDEIQKDVTSFTNLKQMNFLDTLNYIKTNHASFARFGDGELRMMFRPGYSLKFQKNSPELRAALKQTINTANQSKGKLLIGFPHPFDDMHWKVIWAQIWEETRNAFSSLPTLGDAHTSRPMFFKKHGQSGVEAWRELWEGLNVCIVTGKGSRFDLVPELFDGAKSSTIFYSKPVNGFEDIPKILETLPSKDFDIYVISLGPAGTVLAAEMSVRGAWALDVGHLSDSYLNVFKSAPRPESNPLVRKKN